ncbi:hypothetical protein KC320_g3380 [Hortaea werneckii]|nr:hypothetical protein KC320_g3380 [Hortaea werneckii]
MQHPQHHHPTNPPDTLYHKRILIPLWTTSLAFTTVLFVLGITHTLDIENVYARKYPRDWSYETQNIFAGSAIACGFVTLALDITAIVRFGSPKYVLRPGLYAVCEGTKVGLWGYYFVLTCVFHGGPNLWADYFLSVVLVVVGGCGVGYAWTVVRKGRRREESERRAWNAERMARGSSGEDEGVGDVVRKPEAVKREYEMNRLA